MRRVLIGFIIAAVLVAFAAAFLMFTDRGGRLFLRILLKPSTSFAEASTPAAADYTLPSSWAALPAKQDKADLRPAGESAAQTPDYEVDVFFIHPTTYLSRKGWNGAPNDPEAQLMLHEGVMRFQAAAFNQCCYVYAPHYRQATLWAFMDEGQDGGEALKLAYSDVRRAFAYFLRYYNRGRPFILASHSQGSLHGMRLLAEEIAPDAAILNRLVAAYLIGYSIPADMGLAISPCDAPAETGCYINWNSVLSTEDQEGWLKTSKIWFNGEMTRIAGRPLACVNPLNWRLNGSAPASANEGGLPSAGLESPLMALVAGVTGARCEKGLLVITEPEAEGFDALVFGDTDYHIYDYNLFYESIRKNAGTRAASYLDQ